jgi:hypothetical protein
MNFLKQLGKITIIKKLASVKITVVCLFLLFVLTFWGTVAQVNQGLYAAQERFFASLIFLVFNIIPFPGAQLVLWVLFINLTCVTVTRFIHYFKPRYAGILVIHFGLLSYLAAAFVIFHVSVESNVHLKEKEGTNISASYSDWELACWTQKGDKRKVSAFDLSGAMNGQRLKFNAIPVEVIVNQFYPNAHAYSFEQKEKNKSAPVNASGIALLEPQEILIEREKNVAGGVFEVRSPGQKNTDILLYGAETVPTSVQIGETTYYFALQHKKFQLPLTIELVDFRADFHPGTEMAKSYESTVKITRGDTSREVVISMNNPLTFRDYTFFQASYDIDSQGNEYSTFAVVKNVGRFLPYISSLITFSGLALHFFMMAFSSRRKKGTSA